MWNGWVEMLVVQLEEERRREGLRVMQVAQCRGQQPARTWRPSLARFLARLSLRVDAGSALGILSAPRNGARARQGGKP